MKTLFDSLYSEMYPRMEIEISEDRKKEINLFLEHGFIPYFSFYGEGNILKPNINWLAFYGMKCNTDLNGIEEFTYLNLVICLGRNSSEYTVYKNGKKVCVFNSAEDIFDVFDLSSYVPADADMEMNRIIERAAKLMNDKEWNAQVELAAKDLKKVNEYGDNAMPVYKKVNGKYENLSEKEIYSC